MRIAIFNTVQLETAGGMEHFSIQTAAYLASLSGVEVDCVTMDELFNLRYGRLHSLYFFRRFDRATIFREPREAIEQRLGQARYVQCATFAELRETLRTSGFRDDEIDAELAGPARGDLNVAAERLLLERFGPAE